MKKIVASLAIAAISAFAAPQLSLPNSVPELSIMAGVAEKKAIVLSNMNIQDPTQLANFGKLYDEYQVKLFDLMIKRDETIIFFAKNYQTLTDAQAKEIVTKWDELRESKAKLIADYAPKFEKVLSATQVLRYYQIESKLGAAADFRITDAIPLANKAPAAQAK